MGKTVETLKWSWKNKKWLAPTVGVLGLVLYLEGPELAAASRDQANEMTADNDATTTDSQEGISRNRTAYTIAGLVCKKTTVLEKGDKQIIKITTNRALPNDATLHYVYKGYEDTDKHYGGGDRGSATATLSDNHGEVYYVDPTITQGDKEVDCPAWQDKSAALAPTETMPPLAPQTN